MTLNNIPQIQPVFDEDDRQEVRRVMDSGFVTEGKKTGEFELELARFLGVPHALVVNNATVALTIALQALGIGPGDEVIVPDFTFVATANAVSLTGASPVFADIRRDTFTLDLENVAQRITRKTKAIIPVHLNGRSAGMLRLREIARSHRLSIVEDAAQAMGSSEAGQFLGTFGHAGAYSLGTTKIITSGQGGVIVTRDKKVHEACARIKDHGRLSRSSEVHDTIGFNSKFTDLQAALGLAQLRKLPARMETKRTLFRWYREFLAGISEIAIPGMDLANEVPWFVDILHSERTLLEAHLNAAGIETRRFYRPVHSQPCYGQQGNYSVTQEISARGLWLPSSVNLTRKDVETICVRLREFVDSKQGSKTTATASA